MAFFIWQSWIVSIYIYFIFLFGFYSFLSNSASCVCFNSIDFLVITRLGNILKINIVLDVPNKRIRRWVNYVRVHTVEANMTLTGRLYSTRIFLGSDQIYSPKLNKYYSYTAEWTPRWLITETNALTDTSCLKRMEVFQI